MNRAAMTTSFLRVEGLALALFCTCLYGSLRQSWWLFVLLLIAPDLSILGYLRGPRIGAIVYNVVHSWALVVVWFALAWYLAGGSYFALSLPLILGAHIGLDRALGYGLKLPTDFKDTHLGRIGKEPAPAPR